MKKIMVVGLIVVVLALFLYVFNKQVSKTNAAMQKSPEEIIPSGSIINKPHPIPPHS